MQTERYPLKAGRYSSHSKILRLLGNGAGRSLLDVGCAQGHLMSAAQDQGWQVVGIEYNADDARIASGCGLNVRNGSAEDELPKFSEKFDVVVIADVLEHLVDPENVLKLIKERVADDGQIIVSLPNIAHLSVRLSLLLGKFNYADRGILDRTHLHFYTLKSIRKLCENAGVKISSVTVTPAPVEEVLPVLNKNPILRGLLAINDATARSWKSGLAYQYIVTATP